MFGIPGFLIRLGLSIWASLLVYNVISALFGIDRLRRTYVQALRALYKLMGSTMRSSNAHSENSDDNESDESGGMVRTRSFRTFKHEFQLEDATNFIKDGLQVIADDNVTKRFSTSEVEEWNFLTRTQMQVNLGLKTEILLWLSIVFRFAIFFVIRLPIGITSLLWLLMTVCVLSVLTSIFPDAQWRRNLERYCSRVCGRLIGAALSAVINVHNRSEQGQWCS